MSYKTGFYKGRLGIGLTSTMGMGDGNPRYPLDINGDIRLTGAIVNAEGNAINMVTPDSLWQVGVGVISYTFDLSGNPGKVGIGTQNPTAKLQISGTSTNPSTSTQSSTSSQGILRLQGTGGVFMDLGFQSSSPYAGWIQTHNGTTDGVGDDLLLQPVTGNVGIGTTSPQGNLHINSGTTRGGELLLSRENPTSTNMRACAIWLDTFSEAGWGTDRMCFAVNAENGSDIGNPLNKTPQMVLKANGNVGIGTTSPYAKLIVQGTSEPTTGTGYTNTPANMAWPIVVNNVSAAFGNPSNAGYGCGIKFKQYFDNTNDQRWSGIAGVSLGQYSNYTGLAFYTCNDYVTTEKMRIDNAGNVGIGTTTPDQKLEINGWISRSAHGVGGFCGSYNNIEGNSKKTNPIYIIGSNYKPTDTTFGNMYGIGFCHSYESGTGDDSKWPKCGPYNGWGMYICADGDPRIFMSASEGPEICLRGSHPTIFLRDTNQRGAALHVNSNIFYILNGNGSSDSTTWSSVNGYWAMEINLNTNECQIGGMLRVKGSAEFANCTWTQNNGNYGSVMLTGEKDGGYWGIQFGTTGDAPKIMSAGSNIGLYFDGPNEWGMYCNVNGHTYLHYNGSEKLRTRNDGVEITGHTYSNGLYGESNYYNPGWRWVAYMTGEGGGGISFHYGNWSGYHGGFSIYSATGVWADGAFVSSSDRRIKENIEDVPDELALEQIRNIPCRYYNYKDKVNKSPLKTVGFIAQEVIDVLPQAVTLEKGFIPDVNKMLENCTWEAFESEEDDPDNIEKKKIKYKMKTDELQNVSGIKYQFSYTNDPVLESTETKKIIADENDTFIFDNKYKYLYCYGKEVDDFHTLHKQVIFALHHSAIQEIDRKQLIDEEEIKSLKEEIKFLKEENNYLKEELVSIKSYLGI